MCKYVFVLAILLSIFASHSALASDNKNTDPVLGLWVTQDKDGVVELYECGNEICGRFHWLKDEREENGDISRDTHNPDPEKRQRPLCHMQFMGGFKPEGKGRYTDGWIYSPHHGSNFSAEITLVDYYKLNLRGYFLFSFLGENQTWERTDKSSKCTTGTE